MRQINTYDAKNKLSELLDAVLAGESIEIMRRGKAVARLTPVPDSGELFANPSAAATWLRAHRIKIRKIDVRALIDEGRR